VGSRALGGDSVSASVDDDQRIRLGTILDWGMFLFRLRLRAPFRSQILGALWH
jgi:hypothetical protein